jgi:hypothetical protein
VHEHVEDLRLDVLDDAAPAELEPARINRAVLELVDRADERTARLWGRNGTIRTVECVVAAYPPARTRPAARTRLDQDG